VPRAAQKDKTELVEAEPVEAQPTEAPPEKQPDGVLILKRLTPDGGIDTQAVPLGEVQATEVATLIELGLQSWRKSIGLGPTT